MERDRPTEGAKLVTLSSALFVGHFESHLLGKSRIRLPPGMIAIPTWQANRRRDLVAKLVTLSSELAAAYPFLDARGALEVRWACSEWRGIR